ALDYAALGWPVFPITPGKKKPPLIDGWPEKATTDQATIKEWWTKWPDANVAVLTGSRSRLLVVDVDRHDANGFKTLQKLIKKHGKLPTTLTSITPNDGKHLFFTVDRKFKSSAGKLGPGIDIRAERAYVIVPPSRIGGKRYAWTRT